MALPDGSSNRFFKCGLVQASVWGTETAAGATNELVVNDDGNPRSAQPYESLPRLGESIPKSGRLGYEEPVDWVIPVEDKFALDYQGGPLLSMIAAFFGDLTAPAAVSASAAYSHVWDFEPTGLTDFFSFVTMRPGEVRSVPSCICYKLTLKIANGFLQGQFSMRGNRVINDSAVNGETQVEALTPEVAVANFILAQQGVFRMNTEAGDALESGDVIELSDIQIELERTIDKKVSLGGTYMAFPKEGRPKFTIKPILSYATSAAMAFFTQFKAGTGMKADLTFTGGIADDAVPYSFKLGFPRLKFASQPDAKLQEIMDAQLELIGEEAAAAPTGMTGHVLPWCEVVNLRSTAYVT